MIVVSDTSAITNLAAIHQLRLLPLLYQQVIIPSAVYRELVDINPPAPGTVEVQAASWIEVKSSTNHEIVQHLQSVVRLDPGRSWGV